LLTGELQGAIWNSFAHRMLRSGPACEPLTASRGASSVDGPAFAVAVIAHDSATTSKRRNVMSKNIVPAVLTEAPKRVESGALTDDELSVVPGGATSTTREKLEAAALRMDNDGIYNFVEGFLKTAPKSF
jgi:hypothetical protein